MLAQSSSLARLSAALNASRTSTTGGGEGWPRSVLKPNRDKRSAVTSRKQSSVVTCIDGALRGERISAGPVTTKSSEHSNELGSMRVSPRLGESGGVASQGAALMVWRNDVSRQCG